MNRLKKWLIRKLGGVESLTLPTLDTMTICSTLRMDREFADSETERAKAIEEIGKAIIDGNLAERSQMFDSFTDSIVVRYKIKVVKRGSYIFKTIGGDEK